MIDQIIKLAQHQLGDNFTSVLVLIVFTFYLIRRGVLEVQSWIKEEVLKPYIAPLVEKVNSTVNIQVSHTELLVDHEKRIRHSERVNRILQGKVMGGKVNIGDEEDD